MKCYYCGRFSDDANDHVPPEVLFKGFSSRNYKDPIIISVPSCFRHNSAMSDLDESFAHILSHASSLQSNAAMDVQMQLLQAISKRAMSDRGFSDSRLALTGTKLLRDASDYDENGEVKRRVYGGVYKSNVIKLQKTIFEIIDNVARRICAGLYYYAANGKILMGDTVDNLNVDWVNFSRIDDNGDWIDINVSENIVLNRVFGNYRPPKWVDVVSGSPEVFMSKIIIDKTSKKRLLAKLIFYENITCFCYP